MRCFSIRMRLAMLLAAPFLGLGCAASTVVQSSDSRFIAALPPGWLLLRNKDGESHRFNKLTSLPPE
jgi:hypothetical protein